MLCFPSPIDLHGLRTLVALIAIHLMIQTILVGWQLVDRQRLGDDSWYGLLTHLAWIVVSGIGGLAALLAAWKLNALAARVCLVSWLLLVVLRGCQFLATVSLLTFGMMVESLLMECCFLALVYTFLQRLDYAARRFNDETGIALVEIHVDKSSTPQYVAKSSQYGSFCLLV